MKGLLLLFAILGASELAGTARASDDDAKSVPNEPLILVVDGAGDLKGCSNAIKTAASLYQVRLEVEAFPWSHGHYKLYRDQVDTRHVRVKGKELAEQIAARKKEHPERPILVISHSAGCAVALAACDHLPENTLERQILLAPSVSTRYDLRPALRTSKQGIDVFCSKKDKWALGLVIRCIGSADELHDQKAAGRHGFETIVFSPDDADLYKRLRHHFWSTADEKLGHDGRHHGMHAPAFVKERLMPLWRTP
jgi:hypothetical protein